MPFWVSIILGILSIIYIPSFFEIIPLFFISDLIYGTSGTYSTFGAQKNNFFDIFFIQTIIIILIFITLESIKTKIRYA